MQHKTNVFILYLEHMVTNYIRNLLSVDHFLGQYFLFIWFYCTSAAIGQAVKLASELIKFPQQCMLADRASAYNTVFNATSHQEALQFEHENGCPVILQVR